MTPRIILLCIAIASFTAILSTPLSAQESFDNNLLASDPYIRAPWEPFEGDHVSFKNLPEDVGRSFRGLFRNRNISPIVVGAGMTGLAAMLDENEFDEGEDLFLPVNEPGEETTLGRLGERMGNHYLLPSVIAGLAVTGQIAENRRFEAFSYSLLQGYIVNNLLTTGLKEAVGRTRPNRHNDLSFPSGHTSNAFTWATILSHYYGNRAAIPAYGVASFIAWSRLNMDAHYLSDVMFGAFLGYVVGRTVVSTTDARASDTRVEWHLAASLKGAGLTASYGW